MIEFPFNDIDGISGINIDRIKENEVYLEASGSAVFGGSEIATFKLISYFPNTNNANSHVTFKFANNVMSHLEKMPTPLAFISPILFDEFSTKEDIVYEVYEALEDAVSTLEIQVKGEGPQTRRMEKMKSYFHSLIEQIAYFAFQRHEDEKESIASALKFADFFIEKLAQKVEDKNDFFYESIITEFNTGFRSDMILLITSYYKNQNAIYHSVSTSGNQYDYAKIRDYYGEILIKNY